MLFLGRFNFTLSYRHGSKSTKPDVPSRQFAPDHSGQEVALDPVPIVRCSSRNLAGGREVLSSTLDPGGAPLNSLFVPESVRSEV